MILRRLLLLSLVAPSACGVTDWQKIQDAVTANPQMHATVKDLANPQFNAAVEAAKDWRNK